MSALVLEEALGRSAVQRIGLVGIGDRLGHGHAHRLVSRRGGRIGDGRQHGGLPDIGEAVHGVTAGKCGGQGQDSGDLGDVHFYLSLN
ncbi:hypothetical protein D3C86_2079530 [compost metagenome]